MRLAFPEQRLDCLPIGEVELNLQCRDEIIPILRALQHLYSHAELRQELLSEWKQALRPGPLSTAALRLSKIRWRGLPPKKVRAWTRQR